jgi:DNA-binding LacI/PurR family transcriptional regulator
LSLGHRRILYLHQAPELESLRRRRRWRGHERAMREAEVGEPWLTARYQDFNERFATPEQVRSYFTGPEAPTAVVCWYDGLAMELMNHLRRAGLSVPEDVSVIGYDNLPLGENTWPALDTIDLHMDEQVRHAVDLLSLPARRRAAMSATLITPTLIRRASCAPPPVSSPLLASSLS